MCKPQKGKGSIPYPQSFFTKLLCPSEDSFRYKIKHGSVEEGEEWSRWRMRVAKVVRSQSFETIMGTIIIANLVFLGIGLRRDFWVDVVNVVFLTVG